MLSAGHKKEEGFRRHGAMRSPLESHSITGPSHPLLWDNKNFKPGGTFVTM